MVTSAVGAEDKNSVGLMASPPELTYSVPSLESASQRQLSPTRLAIRDIIDGALLWGLWGSLAWEDIRQRYRRSKIGPFWLTISMGVMIAGMGFLYAELFHTDVHSYLPYLAVGVIVWDSSVHWLPNPVMPSSKGKA